jgi:alginate O-acetyltransferase complex protein AlgI
MTAVAVRRDTKADMLTALSVCVLTLAALLISDWPRWLVMWCIAIGIFAVCKWLSWQPVRAARVSTGRKFGYFLAWPGLDGSAFVGRASARPRPSELKLAIGKTILGLALIVVTEHLISANAYLAGWIGMLGIVFSLHFGLFHVLSWIWRRQGIKAQPLMDCPVLSTSLS